jgi:hypothetical protein
MAEAAKSRFESGFRNAGAPALQAPDGPTLRAANARAEHGQLDAVALREERDRALGLLEQAHESAAQRVEALVAQHEREIASMIEHHQEELDALRAELGGSRRPALGTFGTSGVPTPRVPSLVPLDGEGGSQLAELEDENRELYAKLEAANGEIEETRADAIRLQGERDDALRAADDHRVQLLAEIEAARDEAIQLQAQLDEALRTIDDGRDQAREEQCRLIEELDAVHKELAAYRAELAKQGA